MKQTIIFVTAMVLIGYSVDIETEVDRLFADYQGDRPGAAVLVISHGEPVLTKVYGLADVENGIPVSPQTNFRLASVTKQFTAMAIMQLVQKNKLSYETRLTEIFPDFPHYGNDINIRHLLRHTSGLVDYEDLIPDSATIPVVDRDVLAMLMTLDSTYFAPGTQHRYSNGGYAVLAIVVEQVSGQSFAKYLQQNVFIPVGMKKSVAFRKGVSEIPNRAFGYVIEGDSVRFNDQSVTSSVLGDGGIYTSLVDMFKWDQALYTDKLVSRVMIKEAFTPGLGQYGFGWHCDEYKGHRRVFHTGSTCGFRNAFLRFPDDSLSVIILTNRADPGRQSTAEKIAELYLN